ncbi:MAG TPA: DNA methyltransferase [Thermoanaerobaculia bacterium]|nr:DNA methyltransferase [Thermoanaerobaculia bacterium]
MVDARDVAEAGARAALKRLAMEDPEPFATMSPVECHLRERLRAHAVQLGDPWTKDGKQEIERLITECAYEHWHRMLFARFLAENRLLIHSEHRVPVTLAECEELATEEGEEDGWALASRFAARMLPAIFRPDDPVLSVRLAPEHRQPLEKLLDELPVEVFTADDGLGWVYQFWQTKRKKAVNKSGAKIGADELPAVTQLFTEPYMVHFLLHNTLGAWWAGKVLSTRPELAEKASSEEELRSACALPGYEWTYLRFNRPDAGGSWRPAAGTYDGWPKRASEITVLDPCCGSGHFLVAAFRILVSLRRVEEGLSARDACEAVLRDNLYGLEIDERCTQIAAFNLALAAWAYSEAGGYRPLPEFHVACSGLSVGAEEEEWLKLAGRDKRLREGIRRLYYLFKDSPTLGSLIDPRRELEQRTFQEVPFDELRPLVEQALAREEVKGDMQATEAGIAAQGLAIAAVLLAKSYTLTITNVPYLGRGKQDHALKAHLERHYDQGKADLATGFILRCLALCKRGSSTALVTPQNWLFLPAYIDTRTHLLRESQIEVVVRLGANAFRDMNFWAATTALVIITNSEVGSEHAVFGLDASASKNHSYKETVLQSGADNVALIFDQARQLTNPDARISMETLSPHSRLAFVALTPQGIKTGDDARLRRNWWELPSLGVRWRFLHGAPDATLLVDGASYAVDFEQGESAFARPQGQSAWRKQGVVVKLMGSVTAARYFGEIFDSNVTAVVPKREAHLSAVWAFIESSHFKDCLRALEQSVKVNNATVGKVPFDLSHWQQVAAKRYPNGLPEPETDDPTQWCFHGRPEESSLPLQVAVARLLGYRWPAELDESIRLSSRARELVRRCDELLNLADTDGIVCIPPVRGELPAPDQLHRLLAQSFGAVWKPGVLPGLLEQAGFSGKSLEDWLHDGFFEQHCQHFHQRPFIWHIWDGRRDGFAALINYHKLDHKLLERLTYTVLGDWITHQRQGVKTGELGAENRLAAAEALQKKLALILEGEPPYDIFVRWKPLKEQPIGWEPDLNDGVRMNIRPFVRAGVLRKDPRLIKWTKDRGGEPQDLRPREEFPWFWKDGQFTGERVNDIPLTNAEKRAARAAGERLC